MKVVVVKFDDDPNLYYYKEEIFDCRMNVTVIADTSRGYQFGKVVNVIDNYKSKIDNDYKIIRISNKKDYKQYLLNIKDANSAIEKCKELIDKFGLSMSIIDANYNLDRSQLLFRFVADSRVDFRDLAKELGAIFKTRIELRQIGIRDKAKEVGGMGPCGRKLCCASFLNEFDSVSINMAKNQSLSLNPTKINGVCGRLLCCLKYENDNYSEMKEKFPSIGSNYDKDGITGKVVSVDYFNKTIDIKDENGVVTKVEVDYDSEE